MGILDSIIGTNTSAGTQAGATAGIDGLITANANSNRALRKTTGQANDALTTNTTAGLDALKGGYDSAIGALGNYGTQAQQLLQHGTDAGVATTLSDNGMYSPFVASGGAANTMLGDALGLNGQAGHDAATAAFQTSPGYQFQQDQGADQTARHAASLGLAGSGSTLSAILDQSSRLANTEYANWMSGLQNLGTQGLAAASDVSTNNRTAGGLQASGGSAGAQLAQNTGSSIGNAYASRGTGTAGLYDNLGSGLSSNLTGLGRGISANNMSEATSAAGLAMQAGQAEDSATNINNGIFSKIIGSTLGIPLGGNSLSTPTSGGFSITPGSNGSFSFAPSAASGGSNNILNSLVSKGLGI